eukprot:3026855-Pyramimonas_sp.AAC.1
MVHLAHPPPALATPLYRSFAKRAVAHPEARLRAIARCSAAQAAPARPGTPRGAAASGRRARG